MDPLASVAAGGADTRGLLSRPRLSVQIFHNIYDTIITIDVYLGTSNSISLNGYSLVFDQPPKLSTVGTMVRGRYTLLYRLP